MRLQDLEVEHICVTVLTWLLGGRRGDPPGGRRHSCCRSQCSSQRHNSSCPHQHLPPPSGALGHVVGHHTLASLTCRAKEPTIQSPFLLINPLQSHLLSVAYRILALTFLGWFLWCSVLASSSEYTSNPLNLSGLNTWNYTPTARNTE